MLRHGSNQKGQFLVGGMVFLAALMVIVQAMVWWSRREAVWTKKEDKATKAFYLAEAGYNRAMWKLKERSKNFEDVLLGTPITGYENDESYDDVPGGKYRVDFSSGPLDHQITIVATGKDNSSGEYRALKVILQRTLVAGALNANTISLGGSMNVHWGPMMSTGNISLTAGSNELYPRVLARGSISATGGSYASRDTNPTAPNTDGLNWWSYNQAPGVPDIVPLDLAYYKQVAQSQGNYNTNNSVDANLVDTSTSAVRYYEGNLRIVGSSHFRGVLIVMGNLDFSATAKTPEGNLTVTPPSTSWMEYQRNTPSTGTGCIGGGGNGANDDSDYDNNDQAEGDKACVDQYPGDGGFHVSEPYTIGVGCTAHNHLGGASGRAAVFSGYIYVKGEFKATAATSIHGAVSVQTGGSVGAGNVELFFDDDLRIASSDDSTVSMNVRSWQETFPSAF